MKKILLVDDELIIRKLARNTIQSQGYMILEASNGIDAIELTRAELPNLILLDIKMPGLNGFQVCRTLKDDPLTRNTYIIMLTGDLSDEDREQGLLAGADDFFVKPFSPIELLNKIRAFLENEEEIILPEDSVRKRSRELQCLSEETKNEDELYQLEREQLLLYASDLGKIYYEEVKKAAELKKAYQRLKEMEKMKDAFVSLVSHELRTPLSIIKGYVSLINEVLKNREVSAELQEFIKAIAQSSNKLESLIQELLDFSKMKSGLVILEKEEIAIPGILQLIINDMKVEATKKSIEISFESKSDFRPLRADRARMKEAFSQLLKNAILFTPQGGTISIEAVDEGVWIKVRIIDTGKGIPAHELENIFSPFYQGMDFLTRDVNGIGLGLTIAKHIIEDHGGNIKVESEIGKGSKFIVAIPRSFQDAKELVTELQHRYRPRKLKNSQTAFR